MERKKCKLQKVFLPIAIAGAILYGGLKYLSSEAKTNKVIDVPVARARYSDGDVLESMDFISCSAVILDYKNKAIMAHAPNIEYTEYMFEYMLVPEGDDVYIENVVAYLSNKMQEKGINPQECKAFINAGSNKGLEKITNDLRKAGIKIESFKLDKTPRNIRYNPKTNEININHTY